MSEWHVKWKIFPSEIRPLGTGIEFQKSRFRGELGTPIATGRNSRIYSPDSLNKRPLLSDAAGARVRAPGLNWTPSTYSESNAISTH